MNLTDEKSFEVYQKNLDTLIKIGPQIYNNILALKPDGRQFEEMTTKSGLPNLRVNSTERKYIVHSSIDPFQEAKRLDEFSKDDGIDTIVILGFGLGYHIEYFIKKYPNKNKIIIEPDLTLFDMCLKTRDVTGILKSENLMIVISKNPVDISHAFWELIEKGTINNIRFSALASYMGGFRDFWTKVQEEFIKVYRTVMVNVHTNQFYKFTWAENIIKNVKHLPNSKIVNDFIGKFESVPAIIVSNGPSLWHNIQSLKGLKNKVLIIAAGTAIRTLYVSDIIPDIMLGVDGGEIISGKYNSINRDDIVFAYNLNIHYDCIEKYKGPKLYFRTNSEVKAKFFDEKLGLNTVELQSGGSCANVATDFAVRLGCDPIIYVGQDLCYYEGKSHADRLIDEKEKRSLVQAVDMDGKEVYSVPQLLNMRDWFERYFKDYTGKKTFINSTVFGLPIKGAIRMDIEEAINKYCKNDIGIEERFKSIIENRTQDNRVTKKEIKEVLDYLLDESEKIKSLSNDRLKIVHDILGNLNRNNTSNLVNRREKIDKITKKIEASEFFKNYIYMDGGDFFLAVKNETEESVQKEKDMISKLKILYAGLKKQYDEVLGRATFLNELIENELINYKGGCENE